MVAIFQKKSSEKGAGIELDYHFWVCVKAGKV